MAANSSVRWAIIRLFTAFLVALSETLISLPKNFVSPCIIDLVVPFDKGIPSCKCLTPSNKKETHFAGLNDKSKSTACWLTVWSTLEIVRNYSYIIRISLN